MPKKKIKQITLEDEIKSLNSCLNLAKSRFSFHKEDRFYGPIALLFGITIRDKELYNKPIEFDDIVIFHQQLIERLKDKYAARKYITDADSIIKDETILPPIKLELAPLEIQPKSEETIKEIHLGRENLDEEKESEVNSVFISQFPDQKARLLKQKDGCEQEETARQLFNEIWYNLKPGFLLNAQTGAGKTYILASVIKNLLHQGYLEKARCISPLPVVYITKTSVVEQTKVVLKDEFGLDTIHTVHVFNIETLRSQFGKLFIKEKVNVVNGQEVVEYEWNSNIVPALIILDECQILAREESIQSKIIQALNRVKGKLITQIFASATPGSRVCEFRCFAVSTKTEFQLGMGMVKLDDRNWRQFSNQIAAPGSPYDYNEAAIKRLMAHLDPYVIRIKNIRPKHKAFNGISKVFFKSAEEREEYDTAWERYQREKNRIEEEAEKTGEASYIQILAQLTIMRKAAEKCKRHHFAEWVDKTWKSGKAPLLAVAFKGTITSTYRILVEEYGWTRDDVSIIWGGSIESLNAKKKLGLKIKKNEAFRKAAEEEGIDFEELGFDLENLEEKTDEQLAFEKLHNLITQKPEEREREKLRFQSQKSRACFFTFKSGGVGLSLHHEHKNALPRETLLTPVYSEKELVQGLGRAPRITSLSDTFQYMTYYAGTIEEAVAERVKMKLRNLKHVVRMRESWEDLFTGKKVMKLKKETEEIMDAVDEFESGNALMEYVEK